MHIDPSHENLVNLLAREVSGPVTMLNMLRFREIADYQFSPELAPRDPISGREAYDRYIEHTLPYLQATGGSVTFMGEGGNFFIGPADERWDLVVLVHQASIEEFFAFAADEAYLAGIGHRTAALLDSRLLPLTVSEP
ncbi:MAG: hypothetical protein R2710_06595 [Acidimicrobiales bacterium]